jgi:hypothetical protein
MDSKMNYFEDLKTIKRIMEESSRFLSLSGLSGLFAGLIALIGGAVAYFAVLKSKSLSTDDVFVLLSTKETSSLRIQLIFLAAAVLILAVGTALYFSFRKSRHLGLRMWTPISKRLLLNFLIPLVSGGIFIVILYIDNQWPLIVPSMLIFYGLALVNAGKFTYSEVFYLGLTEILTGLFSGILTEYPIVFWCIGFGLLHIAYGLFMYRKYEG